MSDPRTRFTVILSAPVTARIDALARQFLLPRAQIMRILTGLGLSGLTGTDTIEPGFMALSQLEIPYLPLPCTVDGCDAAQRAWGLCREHLAAARASVQAAGQAASPLSNGPEAA